MKRSAVEIHGGISILPEHSAVSFRPVPRSPHSRTGLRANLRVTMDIRCFFGSLRGIERPDNADRLCEGTIYLDAIKSCLFPMI
jgi:hypothetical protein